MLLTGRYSPESWDNIPVVRQRYRCNATKNRGILDYPSAAPVGARQLTTRVMGRLFSLAGATGSRISSAIPQGIAPRINHAGPASQGVSQFMHSQILGCAQIVSNSGVGGEEAREKGSGEGQGKAPSYVQAGRVRTRPRCLAEVRSADPVSIQNGAQAPREKGRVGVGLVFVLWTPYNGPSTDSALYDQTTQIRQAARV